MLSTQMNVSEFYVKIEPVLLKSGEANAESIGCDQGSFILPKKRALSPSYSFTKECL